MAYPDTPPTTWDIIALLGPEFWMLAALAGVVGIAVAWSTLARGVDAERSRASEYGLWRTWIGFGCVVMLSSPYRAFDDTADKAMGTFNFSVLVALVVAVLAVGPFWLSSEGGDRAEFGRRLWACAGRVAGFAGALVLAWLVLRMTGVDDPDATPGQGRAGLVALVGLVALYGAGAWLISRHWFGLGAVHPLLPPLLACVTVCVMTGKELHTDGPEVLPLPLWLIINSTAVITTFGVSLVEVCDVVRPQTGPPAAWPITLAVTVTVVLCAAAVLYVSTGIAEQQLCGGPSPLVACR